MRLFAAGYVVSYILNLMIYPRWSDEVAVSTLHEPWRLIASHILFILALVIAMAPSSSKQKEQV